MNVIQLTSRLERLKARGLHGRAILDAAEAPVDWVWEPSIVAGTTCTIGGPPTSGKSTLLFLFLAARASRTPIEVLGRVVKPAPPDRYIVVVEEQNSGGASRKLLRACRSLGLDPYDVIHRVILLAREPMMVGDLAWQDVVGAVKEGYASDIAIDTLAHTTKEDANDEQQQIALYRKFKVALNSAPIAFEQPVLWIVGHTRKGSDADVAARDLAGHHQRVAQTDTLLMLEVVRGSSGQQIAARCHFAKERDNLDGHSLPIRFDQNGQLKTKLGRPGKTDPPPGKDLRERLLDLFVEDALLSENRIRSLVHAKVETFMPVLEGLLAENLVERVKATVQGASTTLFRAKSPQ